MKIGWEIERLEQVCYEITDGSHFSPKTTGQGYPYVTVRDIENDQIDFDNCKLISETDFNQLRKNGCRPYKGNVLFSKDGTVGKVSLVDYDKNFVVLSSLAILRPNNTRIDSAFLKYLLKSPDFLEQAVGKKTGVAIRRIILRNLKSIPIPVPPLGDQQRIVGILDKAFDGIATAKANAEKNLQNALDTFESHLQSVFNQRGEGWMEKKLGDVADLVDCLHKTPSYKEHGFPMVRVTDIKPGFLDLSNTRKVDEQTFIEFSKKHTPMAGDIVFSRVGSYGVSSFVSSDKPFCLGQNTVFILPTINSVLLYYFLNSPNAKVQFDQLVDGTTQPTISLRSIREIKVAFPPPREHGRLIVKLDSLTKETQRLATLYERKLAALEALKKSLLHQAFTGNL